MSADALPAPGDPWGCEASNSSKYVDTITVSGGIVLASVRGVGDLRADFHSISLAPLDSAGVLMTDVGRVARWRCGAAVDGHGDISVDLLQALAAATKPPTNLPGIPVQSAPLALSGSSAGLSRVISVAIPQVGERPDHYFS
jgi:hypothetical protein